MAPEKIIVGSGRGAGWSSSWQLVSRTPGGYDVYVRCAQRVWRPPTDVYETEGQVVVKVEIAGMSEEGLEISLTDGRLVISGERRDQAAHAPCLTYQNMEIHYGLFHSEVELRWTVDEPGVAATYDRGFLYITLPKARQRRIPIRAEGEGS
ncbi:MAG: Hsp20/alpha crystallin family protein [Chloroflexi bacterium]|nr:Hsp20/alpha crystallin family protein [Chloroflexota bacterium]